MSVEALYELRPPPLLHCLILALAGCMNLTRTNREDLRCRVTVAKRGKDIRSSGGNAGMKGVWGLKCGSTKIQVTESVVPLVQCQRKKKGKKICSHVVESHTAFISWRLWPTSDWFSNKKKSVSFTFPLGQTGQVKCAFFLLLWPIVAASAANDTSQHTCAQSIQRCSCVEKMSLFVYTMWSPKGFYADVVFKKMHVHYQQKLKKTSTNINDVNTFLEFFFWYFNKPLQI